MVTNKKRWEEDLIQGTKKRKVEEREQLRKDNHKKREKKSKNKIKS